MHSCSPPIGPSQNGFLQTLYKRPEEIPVQKWFADDVGCSLSRELQIRVGENGIATGKGRSSEESKKRRTEGPSYAPDLASFPKAFPILLADLERGVTARHSPAASLWIISWHQLQQLPSRNCRRRSSLPDSLQRRPQKNFENSRRAYGGE